MTKSNSSGPLSELSRVEGARPCPGETSKMPTATVRWRAPARASIAGTPRSLRAWPLPVTRSRRLTPRRRAAAPSARHGRAERARGGRGSSPASARRSGRRISARRRSRTRRGAARTSRASRETRRERVEPLERDVLRERDRQVRPDDRHAGVEPGREDRPVHREVVPAAVLPVDRPRYRVGVAGAGDGAVDRRLVVTPPSSRTRAQAACPRRRSRTSLACREVVVGGCRASRRASRNRRP